MHRSFQTALVIVTWVLLALSFVDANYLQDQPLLHLPTVFGLLLLGWVARRGVVSDTSMSAIVLFLWLHILGSRYVYSLVPYDEWSQSWAGFSITKTCNFTRNHYDRLVHFAYGVLATVPQVELLRRWYGLGRWSAQLLSFVLVLAAGALYEIFEWLLAVVMAPDWAERYNGQQGDMWDAQKDMTCAMLGSILMAVVMLLLSKRKGTFMVGQ